MIGHKNECIILFLLSIFKTNKTLKIKINNKNLHYLVLFLYNEEFILFIF
jgi:hypothetical protein